jgi:hypothetical protein
MVALAFCGEVCNVHEALKGIVDLMGKPIGHFSGGGSLCLLQ